MSKFELGGIIAAIIAIISFTAYISDMKSDISRIDKVTSVYDNKTLDDWKEKIEKRVESADILPIGTIVATMLPPHEFLDLVSDKNSKNWVPADGRAVEGSKYKKITGNPRVPDLRGMFIRGLNKLNESTGERNDEFADTSHRLDIGGYSFQKCSTKKPNKPFISSFNGDHTHLPGTLSGKTSSNGKHSHKYKDNMFDGKYNDRGMPNKSEDNDGFDETRTTNPSPNHTHSVSITNGRTGNSGKHDHKITDGGDIETRPNNIATYYMIRINWKGFKKVNFLQIFANELIISGNSQKI